MKVIVAKPFLWELLRGARFFKNTIDRNTKIRNNRFGGTKHIIFTDSHSQV